MSKKGRMSNADRAYFKSQAKELYIKGFSLQHISEILTPSIKTLRDWRDSDDWEKEKELHNIRPSEIKKMILEYVVAIKNGESPPYKADDLSKISAAFDRLNDKRKKAVYTMESIDDFCGFMITSAGNQRGKKREELLELLKAMRVYFDLYVNQLLQHD